MMTKNLFFVLILLFAVVGVAQEPVPQLPQTYIDTTFNPPTGTTWPAHTAAAFQSALNSASPGDTIVLDAGVVYTGNFNFPAKSNPSGQWIYIEGTALSSLPAQGTRVKPASNAALMPKIVTPNGLAAFTLPSGANHVRLTGLEIYSASNYGCNPNGTPPENCWSYQLIFANPLPGQAMVDSITVDRCYLHGSPTQDVKQGIEANGSNFAVVDSFISDIHLGQSDSQAIVAFYTPGPIKIVNNFLSATTENVMFGGAGGATNPYVPSDIEFRNNHLYKPLTWAAVGVTIPPNPRWTEKDNLEFKSAQRVLVDSNILENTWVSGQTGYSVLFTVRTNSSGNIAVVNDITFSNNILKNVNLGFAVASYDDSCLPPACTNVGESLRVKIYNNLILFRNPSSIGGTNNFGVLIGQGVTDFVLQHNTFVPAPGTNCYESAFFNTSPGKTTSLNVWILDNAFCAQPTGNGGELGTSGLTFYMGNPAPLAPRFFGNVMYVPTGSPATYPAANYATTVPFTYVSPSTGDYQLLVPNWTDTSDGKIAGVNNAALP
jgi:hypothetical protein